MSELVHGEVIDSARADLWASRSGKSTFVHQLLAKIPPSDGIMTHGRLYSAPMWHDEFRVRLEHHLSVFTQDLLAHGQSVILE